MTFMPAWSEDVCERFSAFGWYVQHIEDGYNLEEIERAIRRAMEQEERPSFISIRTHLGYGSPKQDDASVHGAPLGKDHNPLQREESRAWRWHGRRRAQSGPCLSIWDFWG